MKEGDHQNLQMIKVIDLHLVEILTITRDRRRDHIPLIKAFFISCTMPGSNTNGLANSCIARKLFKKCALKS